MVSSTLALETVRTRSGFDGLRDEWNALAGVAADTVFLTHAWLSNWLTHLGQGHEPLVLVARHDGRLVAALPLAQRRQGPGIRVVEFMGSGTLTPNHLDLLAYDEHRDAARAAFVEHLLANRSEWDVLDLDKLPADTETAKYLERAFSGAGVPVSLAFSAVCPYARLPETYDEYFAGLSKSARRHTRERIRCIGREHPEARFGTVTTEEELDRALDALVRLHQQRWEARGYAGSFADPRVVAFHRDMSRDAFNEGFLRFHTLTEGDQVIACILCYRMNGSVQAYSCAFESSWAPYRPGMVLGAFAIEQSIAEGAVVYDHLEGDEAHKSTWAGHERDNLRFHAFGRGVKGRLAHGSVLARAAAVRSARAVLPPETRERILKRMSRMRTRSADHKPSDEGTSAEQGM